MQSVIVHSKYRDFGNNFRMSGILIYFGMILANALREREREREREK
jgi:hypothetical protein